MFCCWKSFEVRMPEKLIIIGAVTPTIIRVVDDINQTAIMSRSIQIVGFWTTRLQHRRVSRLE